MYYFILFLYKEVVSQFLVRLLHSLFIKYLINFMNRYGGGLILRPPEFTSHPKPINSPQWYPPCGYIYIYIYTFLVPLDLENRKS